MTSSHPLLLASGSPRRRQIIKLLGLDFSVCVPPTDEEAMQHKYQGLLEELAPWLAKHKAAAALTLPEARDCTVIAADTTVLLDEQVLGKPRDKAHARELLLALRGRKHHVVTGIAVSGFIGGKRTMLTSSCITPVLMRPYSVAEIKDYIATGDPLDKAGAYGIQHPSFQPTQRIDGCYFNVVGLPLCALVDLLAEFRIYPARRGQHGEASTCPWSEQCQI
ncbi:MAG TPA: Maf family protein [Ktedonobacteraceae bacterium]|nr:Maf family protein [Ktedonobacteraceae bacterium]